MGIERQRSGSGTHGIPWPSLRVALVAAAVALAGIACSARPPRNTEDICDMFGNRRGWYRAAKKASEKWGVPIHVQLAIIHQESRFRAKAKPPRRRILWIIPGPRPSSALGYTQALKSTWKDYVRSSGNCGADRDSFSDATDFIGWYAARTAEATGVFKGDAYSLYLAYHEGNGGFLRGTYRGKPWLLKAARRVQERSRLYERQLITCEERFKRRWWQFWIF